MSINLYRNLFLHRHTCTYCIIYHYDANVFLMISIRFESFALHDSEVTLNSELNSILMSVQRRATRTAYLLVSMFPSVHNSEHLIRTGTCEGGLDIADFVTPELMNTFIIWDTSWSSADSCFTPDI